MHSKGPYRERDLECVLERALSVFFSSASKFSSSRPSGPSSRSMSYNSAAITPRLYLLLLQSFCFSKPPIKRTCCWLSMESSSLLSVSGSCAWLLFCVDATQLSGPNSESCPSIEMVCKKENNNALNFFKVSRHTKSTLRNTCGKICWKYLLLVLLMLQKLLLKLLQVLLL